MKASDFEKSLENTYNNAVQQCLKIGCSCHTGGQCTTGEELCNHMILTPHYDNGHNGGLWCAEKKPCKLHQPMQPKPETMQKEEWWSEDFDIQVPGYSMNEIRETGVEFKRPIMVQRKDALDFIKFLLHKDRERVKEMIEFEFQRHIEAFHFDKYLVGEYKKMRDMVTSLIK